jgi:hypothetical protein
MAPRKQPASENPTANQRKASDSAGVAKNKAKKVPKLSKDDLEELNNRYTSSKTRSGWEAINAA